MVLVQDLASALLAGALLTLLMAWSVTSGVQRAGSERKSSNAL